MPRKRSKASYRRAALKGHATRQRRAKARSRAAKRGWKTRRANEAQRQAAKEQTAREFVLHFDYGSKKKRNLIQFQVHVTAPQGVTDAEAIKTIRQWDHTGQLPKGWKQLTIQWSRAKSKIKHQVDSAIREVQTPALLNGRATVRRKNPV